MMEVHKTVILSIAILTYVPINPVPSSFTNRKIRYFTHSLLKLDCKRDVGCVCEKKDGEMILMVLWHKQQSLSAKKKNQSLSAFWKTSFEQWRASLDIRQLTIFYTDCIELIKMASAPAKWSALIFYRLWIFFNYTKLVIHNVRFCFILCISLC